MQIEDTDGSRPLLAQGPAALAQLLVLLSAQVDAATRESAQTVAGLRGTLTAVEGCPNGGSATAVLQFHERLTRQLTDVRDALASVALAIRGHAARDRRVAWEQVLSGILAALSDDQCRQAFGRLVQGPASAPGSPGVAAARAPGAADGIDFF